MSKEKNIDKTIEFIKKYKKAFGMCPRQVDISNEFGWSRQYVGSLFQTNEKVLEEFTEYRVWYFDGGLKE